MPSFKDFIKQDLATFVNPNEFGTLHKINNREMTIIVDEDRLVKREKKEFDGISIGELLYFVKVSDYGNRPSINEVQKFNKKQMYVADVKEHDGIYEIILSQNLGG